MRRHITKKPKCIWSSKVCTTHERMGGGEGVGKDTSLSGEDAHVNIRDDRCIEGVDELN